MIELGTSKSIMRSNETAVMFYVFTLVKSLKLLFMISVYCKYNGDHSPCESMMNTIVVHYMFSLSTTWDRSTMHSKFDPTGVRTHDLQIMTVHFMSLRRLL